jgi:hypothetical protein
MAQKNLDEMVDIIVEEYLNNLQEDKKSKSTSFAKITRQTKIDRAIGALSTKLAKEMNDPWYRKMVGFRKKYFDFRNKIKVKYGPKVRTRAVTGKGISDLIQKIKADKKK